MIGRRDAIGALGAGALFLQDVVGRGRNPAVQVEDRATAVRISSLRAYLQERCVDILQPDAGHTGGITQLRKIAILAEAYAVPLAPHCTMSELGLTASLHVAAAIPNFLIHEAYLDGHLMPAGVARKAWEVDKAGDAPPPPGPGLGVEMDEARIAEADPRNRFRWPTPRARDGGVTDT